MNVLFFLCRFEERCPIYGEKNYNNKRENKGEIMKRKECSYEMIR